MPSKHSWSEQVVRGEVNGHPSLMYAERPQTILAAVDESRRWGTRSYITHGSRIVSFEEHAELVMQIASRLRSEGFGVGDRVGIFSSNSPEWVASFFAILEIGAIVVPCNSWWSAEEMDHACAQTGISGVIADERRRERVPIGVPVLDTSLGEITGDVTLHPSEPRVELPESAPAVILFTAGTTDFPKGATLSHRALVSNLQTLLLVSRKLPHQITSDNPASVTLVGLPLFHIGAIQLFLVPLVTGSEIVFLQGKFDPDEVLGLVESRGVTMFSGVPTMMERLLASEEISKRDLTSLRTVVLGGSVVDDALLARIRAAFPSTTRGVGQTYGLTEAGGVVSTGVGSDIQAHPGSSGRVAPVVEVIVSSADGGVSGEILVRSPAAMDGYWGISDDETISADGWISTGDVGYVDAEGFLYVTGRTKDVIIRGGENVAAARVESVLRSHPAVAEAAVVGLPDTDLGEVVAAVVRLSDGESASVEDLTSFASQRLAHFAVPSRWWFRPGPLPTNDAGKVLKRILRAEWP